MRRLSRRPLGLGDLLQGQPGMVSPCTRRLELLTLHGVVPRTQSPVRFPVRGARSAYVELQVNWRWRGHTAPSHRVWEWRGRPGQHPPSTSLHRPNTGIAEILLRGYWGAEAVLTGVGLKKTRGVDNKSSRKRNSSHLEAAGSWGPRDTASGTVTSGSHIPTCH